MEARSQARKPGSAAQPFHGSWRWSRGVRQSGYLEKSLHIGVSPSQFPLLLTQAASENPASSLGRPWGVGGCAWLGVREGLQRGLGSLREAGGCAGSELGNRHQSGAGRRNPGLRFSAEKLVAPSPQPLPVSITVPAPAPRRSFPNPGSAIVPKKTRLRWSWPKHSVHFGNNLEKKSSRSRFSLCVKGGKCDAPDHLQWGRHRDGEDGLGRYALN